MRNYSPVNNGREKAKGQDFCRIFREEMTRLYSIAFLLTGNHNVAEQCFAASLEECLNTHSVFKEWAISWSRRVVIKNAIRFICPASERNDDASLAPEGLDLKSNSALADAVLRLEQFQRFVIVMSVLEGYSDKECAILLNCSSREIATGRSQGLRQLARSAGPRLTSAAFRHELEMTTEVPPSFKPEAASDYR